MKVHHALILALFAAAVCGADVAEVQNCTRTGDDVTCADGRRGILSGDAIVWADGTKSSRVNPHPSVIVGNKASVIVGHGVMVGSGKGIVPMENPAGRPAARRWRACPTASEARHRFSLSFACA